MAAINKKKLCLFPFDKTIFYFAFSFREVTSINGKLMNFIYLPPWSNDNKHKKWAKEQKKWKQVTSRLIYAN